MDFLLGAGAVKASSALTGRQLEHGVGLQENQTNLKKKNALRCGKTESITTLSAKQHVMMTIQDTSVRSKSVSS